jgi:hypothetical protein
MKHYLLPAIADSVFKSMDDEEWRIYLLSRMECHRSSKLNKRKRQK